MKREDKKLITQKFDESKRELSNEGQAEKKVFVEPQISNAIDVLEATAFFQPITGNPDATPPDLVP